MNSVAEKLGVEFNADEMSEPAGVAKFLQRISTHARRQERDTAPVLDGRLGGCGRRISSHPGQSPQSV